MWQIEGSIGDALVIPEAVLYACGGSGCGSVAPLQACGIGSQVQWGCGSLSTVPKKEKKLKRKKKKRVVN